MKAPKGYATIKATAQATGFLESRIEQMIRSLALPVRRIDGSVFVSRTNIAKIKYEQSLIEAKEACALLHIGLGTFNLAVQKKVLLPRNKISKIRLFEPDEVRACLLVMKKCFTIEETAKELGYHKRHVYKLIESGDLQTIETIHGSRIIHNEVAAFKLLQA